MCLYEFPLTFREQSLKGSNGASVVRRGGNHSEIFLFYFRKNGYIFAVYGIEKICKYDVVSFNEIVYNHAYKSLFKSRICIVVIEQYNRIHRLDETVVPVKATILGYDLKEDVVEHCNAIAQKYGYDGLRFVVSDVTRDTLADTPVDMVVTLHACDTATDYALWYAVEKGVKHIFSVPCCQHEINATIHKGGDFDVLLRHGLLQERFSALLTDSIRAAVLEDMGYTVDVIEFIDFAHSPKNLMLRCVKDRRAGERNLSAAWELAEKYGFRQALLELAEKKCHSAQNTAF